MENAMATATAPAKPAPAPAISNVPVARTTSPFELMRHFAQEMDRVFGDFGLRTHWPFAPVGEREPALWTPDLEVTQDKDKLQVRLDLPGLRKEDVTIEISEQALTVEGERRQEEEEKEKGYYRTERSYGRFFRSIPLPEGARPDSTKATFANGVLEIVMDVEAPQPPAARRIEIAEPAKPQV
jgi:HSP20 family protein